MGGGNSAQQASTQLAQQQTQTGNQFLGIAQGELAQSAALEQPLINFYTGVTNTTPGALQTALAPQLGHISQNTQQAEANVMRSVAPGAGQQAALVQAGVQQGQQIAKTENAAVQNAFTGLAQIGASRAGVGLSEASTGLSGMSGAQQAYGTQQQVQAQEKSSMMGTIGSIVGGAAGVGAAAIGNSGGGDGGGGAIPASILSPVTQAQQSGALNPSFDFNASAPAYGGYVGN
jgi:hypothetical protein